MLCLIWGAGKNERLFLIHQGGDSDGKGNTAEGKAKLSA